MNQDFRDLMAIAVDVRSCPYQSCLFAFGVVAAASSSAAPGSVGSAAASCKVVSINIVTVSGVRRTCASRLLRQRACHFVSFRFAFGSCQRTDSVQASSEDSSSAGHSVDSRAFAVFAVKC